MCDDVQMTRRGPYAKTAPMRERVVQAAVRMIGEQGLSSTTIEQIAEAVGMTRPGLLHHFGSREKLLLAVIAHSDYEMSLEEPGRTVLEDLIKVDERNLERPGLVALYLGLVGNAASERGDTPSRRAFRERYGSVRELLIEDVRSSQERGIVRADIDAELIAALIVAASDGLQMQRLIDESVPAIRALHALQVLLAPVPVEDSDLSDVGGTPT
jgi:AcrR family transcriptional regulator